MRKNRLPIVGGLALVLGAIALLATHPLDAQTSKIAGNAQPAASGSGIQHIIWIWFENRETTQITQASAPYFASFAAANVNLTNFYAATHPSQPNYLDAFSGSNQGVTGDAYCTFPASTDNLAKQLAVAGKSWRVYAQDYPGNCSDVQTFAGVVDGPGVAGTYVRKHNPAMGFESVRLDSVQCANIQHLASFDPTVNFAFVAPNLINDMHDGTIAQGDAFLQAFVPLVTASPDWAHTLLIVTFDEGTTNANGGGHVYTAAAAPWLPHANVATTYTHFSVLRTIEQVFGLPFLGGAATATTITEILPPAGTATPTPTPTPPPTPTPSTTPSPPPTPTLTPTPSPTATPPPPTPTSTPTPNEPHFEVSAPVVVSQGESFNITVTAKLFNNVFTGYTGTVHFTSTASSGAHLPPDSTLTNGVGIFSVTFDVPGNYTITARDTVNPSMIGTSGTIFVAVIDPPTPTVGPTATPGASPTPSPTPTLTPTPPPSPTPSATPSPTPPAQALNLSTRMRVQTGDNVGIGGFIITGTGPKHVLLRAIGPSLTASGVPDALADPVLELHGPSPFVTVTDDNWRDDPAQEALIIASGIQPTNDLESAIDATLVPGNYTAIVRGQNNTSGVGLVEVYDLSQVAPAKLANISTRAFVSTGANIVIGGFFLGGGSANDRIAVRGLGPSLTAAGVPNALADPTLELRDGDGALLVSNNDWQDNPVQASELIAAGLAPTNPLESGIAATLPPGPYTALLSGLNNGTGVGLVEVYDRGSP